jgi:hypothetical protein
MRNRYRALLQPSSLLVVLLCLPSFETATTAQTRPASGIESPFRYVIVFNELDDSAKDFGIESQRKITVLLDRNSFSEKNLKTLYELLSRRFPAPPNMQVYVKTSLNDIETPEEHDNLVIASGIDSGPGAPASPQLPQGKNPSAKMIRGKFYSRIFYEHFPTPASKQRELVLQPYTTDQSKTN